MSKSELVFDLESLLSKSGSVSIKETSKSWVFHTCDAVFKLKKPVRDELQDLTSLQARHDNALTEIDLNRRLAPDLYLDAIRVGRRQDGQLVLDTPEAETVDWLVKMRRLPALRMLDDLLAAETPPAKLSDDVGRVVQTLVDFYQSAEVTRLKARELMPLLADQITMSRQILLNPLFEAHHTRFRHVLDQMAILLPSSLDLLEERVTQGAIRECHGDLRPEHICLTNPPVVYDCLEFNRILQLSDPYSEATFLGMECAMLGGDWVGPRLIKGLERRFGPAPDPALMRIYTAYHAVIRARLSFAHLLVPVPRQPKKWETLGLRYLAIAEASMCLKGRQTADSIG